MKELYARLAHSPASHLEELLRASASPDLDGIVGWDWAGFNTPATSALLGIRKFIKVFERGPEGVEGYNLRASGTSLEEPWVPRGNDRTRSKVGLYAVLPPLTHPGPYRRAALIDYGARPDQFWVARMIDDYLVQPDQSEDDVLLGKAYLCFGRARVPAGYFVLERLRPTAPG